MKKGGLEQLIESMDPREAAVELADSAKKLFSILGEDALRDFLTRLMGNEREDKIAGLVHL